MGFEGRWRVDPILPVDGWKETYARFLFEAAAAGHEPTRIALGTYREMGRSLLTIGAKWGLPPMKWNPGKLRKDGMHYHLPAPQRIDIYRNLSTAIGSAWQGAKVIPIVALCKESRSFAQLPDSTTPTVIANEGSAGA